MAQAWRWVMLLAAAPLAMGAAQDADDDGIVEPARVVELEAVEGVPDPPGEDKLPPVDFNLDWYALNATASFNLSSGSVSRHVSLNGRLNVPEQRDIAAHLPVWTEVIDGDGRVLLERDKQEADPPFASFNRVPPTGHNGQIHVNLTLSPMDVTPESLSAIRGYVEVLEITERRSVDLPLAEAAKPTALLPDLAFRITKIERSSNRIMVHYESDIDHPEKWEQVAEPPFVWGFELRDEAGVPVKVYSTPHNNVNSNGSGYLRFYFSRGEPEPTTLRIVVAQDLKRRRVDFELRDVWLARPRPRPDDDLRDPFDPDPGPGRGPEVDLGPDPAHALPGAMENE